MPSRPCQGYGHESDDQPHLMTSVGCLTVMTDKHNVHRDFAYTLIFTFATKNEAFKSISIKAGSTNSF